jgi:hypothetical protein
MATAASTLNYNPNDIETILPAIDASRQAELQRYINLRNPTISDAERSSIRSDINGMVDERAVMFQALIRQQSLLAGIDETMAANLQEEINRRTAAEAELNAIKSTLPDKNKTLKMVEINAYYGKQYAGYANFMKWAVIVAALILVSYWAQTYVDPAAMSIARLAIYVIGGGYVALLGIDLMLRRSDKYDEYLWPFAPVKESQLADANSVKRGIEITGINMPGICAGTYCCGEGTIWDGRNGCIPTPAKSYVMKNK